MTREFTRLDPESYRSALVPRLRKHFEPLRKRLLGEPPMDDKLTDPEQPTPTAEELQK